MFRLLLEDISQVLFCHRVDMVVCLAHCCEVLVVGAGAARRSVCSGGKRRWG